MKQLIIQTKNVALIFVSFLALNSCKVTFVPSYDSKISEQIDETSKSVDLFYLNMLETTSDKDTSREFDKFSEKYVELEVELNSLLNKNKVRPLNKSSTRICEITLQLWQKYKGIHKKDDKLTNGEIIYNRKIFNDLFYAMQVAEIGKKLAENPPQ
jgi:hypothetical protein